MCLLAEKYDFEKVLTIFVLFSCCVCVCFVFVLICCCCYWFCVCACFSLDCIQKSLINEAIIYFPYCHVTIMTLGLHDFRFFVS